MYWNIIGVDVTSALLRLTLTWDVLKFSLD